MSQEFGEGGDRRSMRLESSAEEVALGRITLSESNDLPEATGPLIPIERALDGFTKLRKSFREAEAGARSAGSRLVVRLRR
jgi:hypothetical protein